MTSSLRLTPARLPCYGRSIESLQSVGNAVDEHELKERLDALVQEHRDLDDAILALVEKTAHDQLQLARLKKRKLRLKDEIIKLNDMLLPDIIA